MRSTTQRSILTVVLPGERGDSKLVYETERTLSCTSTRRLGRRTPTFLKQPQRSERWMYRSAGPNWRIQVDSSEYMYLSGKRCNTILKFRTSGTRYSQFSSLSSVTLFWRQKLN